MQKIDCWLTCLRSNIVIRLPPYNNTLGDDTDQNPLRLGRSLFDFFTLSSHNNNATSPLVACLK